MTTPTVPESFTLLAADGCPIKGSLWRHRGNGRDARPVVIINPATSVRCRYYFRFAAFLFRHGFDVIAYDYRGIGESRPATLRGFDAGWIEWGRLDFDAVLRYAERSFSGQPIHVVAHSIGGFVLGLAESNHRSPRPCSTRSSPRLASESGACRFARWTSPSRPAAHTARRDEEARRWRISPSIRGRPRPDRARTLGRSRAPKFERWTLRSE